MTIHRIETEDDRKQTPRKPSGFAVMPKEKVSKAGQKGNQVLRETGQSYGYTSETAREAAKKRWAEERARKASAKKPRY